MILNAIILRDIPKEEARVDLFRHAIQGGFRGFYAEVPLVGWHYVSVKVSQFHTGFWCHLTPGQVVVRVFDGEKFVEDDPETAQHYTELALSGAMQQALTPYPIPLYAHWFGLVSHLSADNFPPQLHTEDAGTGSRFERAWQNTHSGQSASFLAEFQYAFVRWLISLDMATEDKIAWERWQHLLQSIYNAGEDRIRAASDLFPRLVDILIRQFDLLPAAWFGGDSALTTHANYLTEDLIDTDVPELANQGRMLARYLEKRQQG